MTTPTSRVATVRVTGPLVPFAEAYEAKMRARGYTPLTMVNELRQVAHLSYWLDEHEMTAADVTSEVIEALHDLRRTRRSSANCSLQGLLALLEVLDPRIVREVPPPTTRTAGFDCELLRVQGAAVPLVVRSGRRSQRSQSEGHHRCCPRRVRFGVGRGNPVLRRGRSFLPPVLLHRGHDGFGPVCCGTVEHRPETIGPGARDLTEPSKGAPAIL